MSSVANAKCVNLRSPSVSSYEYARVEKSQLAIDTLPNVYSSPVKILINKFCFY